jgi:hypothetical protein
MSHPKSNATRSQKRSGVLEAATEWWKTLRPTGWDTEAHVRGWWVNTAAGPQRELARWVAAYVAHPAKLEREPMPMRWPTHGK